MFRGNFRLNAAPGVTVSRDDDSAFDGDAAASKLIVILGNAIIHINERAGDITVGRIGVVGGELLGLLVGSGIDPVMARTKILG